MKKIKFFLLISLFSLVFTKVYSKTDVEAEYAILTDFLSGKILFEKNADDKIYPASMTKIMTAIVAFDLLKSGETSLDEEIIISEKAWRMSKDGFSSMFVMLNDKVTVEDLLKGIIIISGNDACVALAEGLAGSEESFAMLMNEKAEEIGMTGTNFSNSSGINDAFNYSTVRDISLMSSYLIKNYPKFYEYFSLKDFTWDRTGGDPITQGNRNPLLYKNIGVDGIKTGFLSIEKYSLASSIIKKKRRLISVVSGFATKNKRSSESAKLLTWGLTKFDTFNIAKENELFAELDVWLGKKDKVEIKINEDIYVTVPKRKKKYIKAIMEYNKPIKAPIKENEVLGKLSLYVKDDLIQTYDLISKENIGTVNFFSKFIKSINYLIWGDV